MDQLKKLRPFLQAVAVSVLTLVIFYAAATRAAWSPPASSPPNGNVSGPITTSSVGQIKMGNLMLNTDGVLANGLIVASGNVGIGVVNPRVALDVDGGVLVGSTGVSVGGACGTEGTLQYDSTAHALVICGSSLTWAPINPTRTWTNVGASRAALANYVNSTGHDIDVAVTTYSGASYTRCAIKLTVNGIVVSNNFVNNSVGAATCTAYATVPAGGAYQADNTMSPAAGSGENAITAWNELR